MYETIKKHNSDFSITYNLADFIKNQYYRDGYYESTQYTGKVDINSLNKSQMFWVLMREAFEDVGQEVNEKIQNFVEDNMDIFLCRIEALKSMAQQIGMEKINIPRIDQYPLSIYKLTQIFSIPPAKLIGQDLLNNPTINALISTTYKLRSSTSYSSRLYNEYIELNAGDIIQATNIPYSSKIAIYNNTQLMNYTTLNPNDTSCSNMYYYYPLDTYSFFDIVGNTTGRYVQITNQDADVLYYGGNITNCRLEACKGDIIKVDFYNSGSFCYNNKLDEYNILSTKVGSGFSYRIFEPATYTICSRATYVGNINVYDAGVYSNVYLNDWVSNDLNNKKTLMAGYLCANTCSVSYYQDYDYTNFYYFCSQNSRYTCKLVVNLTNPLFTDPAKYINTTITTYGYSVILKRNSPTSVQVLGYALSAGNSYCSFTYDNSITKLNSVEVHYSLYNPCNSFVYKNFEKYNYFCDLSWTENEYQTDIITKQNIGGQFFDRDKYYTYVEDAFKDCFYDNLYQCGLLNDIINNIYVNETINKDYAYTYEIDDGVLTEMKQQMGIPLTFNVKYETDQIEYGNKKLIEYNEAQQTIIKFEKDRREQLLKFGDDLINFKTEQTKKHNEFIIKDYIRFLERNTNLTYDTYCSYTVDYETVISCSTIYSSIFNFISPYGSSYRLFENFDQNFHYICRTTSVKGYPEYTIKAFNTNAICGYSAMPYIINDVSRKMRNICIDISNQRYDIRNVLMKYIRRGTSELIKTDISDYIQKTYYNQDTLWGYKNYVPKYNPNDIRMYDKYSKNLNIDSNYFGQINLIEYNDLTDYYNIYTGSDCTIDGNIPYWQENVSSYCAGDIMEYYSKYGYENYTYDQLFCFNVKMYNLGAIQYCSGDISNTIIYNDSMYGYIECGNINTMLKKYIGDKDVSTDYVMNVKNNMYPSLALTPYMWGLVPITSHSLYLKNVIYIANRDAQTYMSLNFCNMYDRNGNILNVWDRENSIFNPLKSNYEYSSNLDVNGIKGENIDNDTPFILWALDEYLYIMKNIASSSSRNIYIDNFISIWYEKQPLTNYSSYKTYVVNQLIGSSEKISINKYGLKTSLSTSQRVLLKKILLDYDTVKRILDVQNNKIAQFGNDKYKNKYYLYRQDDSLSSLGKMFIKIENYPLALPLYQPNYDTANTSLIVMSNFNDTFKNMLNSELYNEKLYICYDFKIISMNGDDYIWFFSTNNTIPVVYFVKIDLDENNRQFGYVFKKLVSGEYVLEDFGTDESIVDLINYNNTFSLVTFDKNYYNTYGKNINKIKFNFYNYKNESINVLSYYYDVDYPLYNISDNIKLSFYKDKLSMVFRSKIPELNCNVYTGTYENSNFISKMNYSPTSYESGLTTIDIDLNQYLLPIGSTNYKKNNYIAYNDLTYHTILGFQDYDLSRAEQQMQYNKSTTIVPLCRNCQKYNLINNNFKYEFLGTSSPKTRSHFELNHPCRNLEIYIWNDVNEYLTMNVVEKCTNPLQASYIKLPQWNNYWDCSYGKYLYTFKYLNPKHLGTQEEYKTSLIRVRSTEADITDFIYEGIYPHKMSIEYSNINNCSFLNKDIVINGYIESLSNSNITVKSMTLNNCGIMNINVCSINRNSPKFKTIQSTQINSENLLNINNNEIIGEGVYYISDNVITSVIPKYQGVCGNVCSWDSKILFIKGALFDACAAFVDNDKKYEFELDAGISIYSNDVIIDGNL